MNRKNSAAVAAAEAAQLQQQFVQAQFDPTPKMKSEPGAAEAGEHQVLSYPPHPPPLGQMNMHPDMRYQTHPAGLPLMQNAYVPAAYPGSAPMPNGGVPQARTGGDPPPKTFHCSTCSKGFARRSDLARHGKIFGSETCDIFKTDMFQSGFTQASDPTLAIGPGAGSSSSNVLP